MRKINKLFILLPLGAAALSGIDCNPAPTTQVLVSASNELPDLATVAYDSDFVDLALEVIDLGGQMRARFRAQSPAVRAQSKAEAQAIYADAVAHEGTPQGLMNRLSMLTGIPANELLQTASLGATVAQKYPGLADTGPAFIGQAVDLNPVLRAAQQEASPPPPPPMDSTEDCIDDCNDDYEAGAAAIAVWLPLQLALCAVIPFPGNAFCAAAAFAYAAYLATITENERQDCIDICNGIEPSDDCDDDTDCPTNQWCDKGPNECKPDKSIGQTCSRDEKCLSGCCKYDFWQHPVSMTCNPPEDCN